MDGAVVYRIVMFFVYISVIYNILVESLNKSRKIQTFAYARCYVELETIEQKQTTVNRYKLIIVSCI